ncbi:MAG TPA: phosphotransferase family protein [Acidimicrobiales bacterium]|nr:phosphotransferase family protein [Acidimicrobiales bacterium]
MTGRAWPWRRDPAAVAEGLAAWAAAWRGPGAAVTGVRAPGSGMSNDTVLFSLDGEALVARLAPAPDAWPTFPAYDVDRQRRVIDLVRERTAVPVPEVVHVEADAAWLGVPFMVSRAVAGDVPADSPPYLLDREGWFLRGSADDHRRLEESTVEVLARLHEVPGDGEAAAFLHLDAPGATPLARQLADQRAYYEWARDGQAVPLLERAFAVLGDGVPANDGCVLLWGDSRPGNIIYRDFAPVAVLDWEMATVGPPEVDVAWATFFHRFFASFGEALGMAVPAMFDPAATAARYERLSGRALDDLRWYEAFAGLRFGIILARMSLRSIAFGIQQPPADPDDLTLFAPLLRRLLDDL